MHVSSGKCTREYAWRDASRLVGRCGTAGNTKCKVLEIYHKMHHVVCEMHLVSCIRPDATFIVREVSCSIRRVTSIIQRPSCTVHQEPWITRSHNLEMHVWETWFAVVLLGSIPSRTPAWSKIRWLSCSLLRQFEVERMISQSNTTRFRDVTPTLTLRTPSLEPDFPKKGELENITFKKLSGTSPG